MNPLQILYHGTSYDHSALIEQEGLVPKNHSAVYLTADINVAYDYAKKHYSNPVICLIDAPQMVADGFVFELNMSSAEYTTAAVPSKYLVQLVIEDEAELETIANIASKVFSEEE